MNTTGSMNDSKLGSEGKTEHATVGAKAVSEEGRRQNPYIVVSGRKTSGSEAKAAEGGRKFQNIAVPPEIRWGIVLKPEHTAAGVVGPAGPPGSSRKSSSKGANLQRNAAIGAALKSDIIPVQRTLESSAENVIHEWNRSPTIQWLQRLRPAGEDASGEESSWRFISGRREARSPRAKSPRALGGKRFPRSSPVEPCQKSQARREEERRPKEPEAGRIRRSSSLNSDGPAMAMFRGEDNKQGCSEAPYLHFLDPSSPVLLQGDPRKRLSRQHNVARSASVEPKSGCDTRTGSDFKPVETQGQRNAGNAEVTPHSRKECEGSIERSASADRKVHHGASAGLRMFWNLKSSPRGNASHTEMLLGVLGRKEVSPLKGAVDGNLVDRGLAGGHCARTQSRKSPRRCVTEELPNFDLQVKFVLVKDPVRKFPTAQPEQKHEGVQGEWARDGKEEQQGQQKAALAERQSHSGVVFGSIHEGTSELARAGACKVGNPSKDASGDSGSCQVAPECNGGESPLTGLDQPQRSSTLPSRNLEALVDSALSSNREAPAASAPAVLDVRSSGISPRGSPGIVDSDEVNSRNGKPAVFENELVSSKPLWKGDFWMKIPDPRSHRLIRSRSPTRAPGGPSFWDAKGGGCATVEGPSEGGGCATVEGPAEAAAMQGPRQNSPRSDQAREVESDSGMPSGRFLIHENSSVARLGRRSQVFRQQSENPASHRTGTVGAGTGNGRFFRSSTVADLRQTYPKRYSFSDGLVSQAPAKSIPSPFEPQHPPQNCLDGVSPRMAGEGVASGRIPARSNSTQLKSALDKVVLESSQKSTRDSVSPLVTEESAGSPWTPAQPKSTLDSLSPGGNSRRSGRGRVSELVLGALSQAGSSLVPPTPGVPTDEQPSPGGSNMKHRATCLLSQIKGLESPSSSGGNSPQPQRLGSRRARGALGSASRVATCPTPTGLLTAEQCPPGEKDGRDWCNKSPRSLNARNSLGDNSPQGTSKSREQCDNRPGPGISCSTEDENSMSSSRESRSQIPTVSSPVGSAQGNRAQSPVKLAALPVTAANSNSVESILKVLAQQPACLPTQPRALPTAGAVKLPLWGPRPSTGSPRLGGSPKLHESPRLVGTSGMRVHSPPSPVKSKFSPRENPSPHSSPRRNAEESKEVNLQKPINPRSSSGLEHRVRGSGVDVPNVDAQLVLPPNQQPMQGPMRHTKRSEGEFGSIRKTGEEFGSSRALTGSIPPDIGGRPGCPPQEQTAAGCAFAADCNAGKPKGQAREIEFDSVLRSGGRWAPLRPGSARFGGAGWTDEASEADCSVPDSEALPVGVADWPDLMEQFEKRRTETLKLKELTGVIQAAAQTKRSLRTHQSTTHNGFPVRGPLPVGSSEAYSGPLRSLEGLLFETHPEVHSGPLRSLEGLVFDTHSEVHSGPLASAPPPVISSQVLERVKFQGGCSSGFHRRSGSYSSSTAEDVPWLPSSRRASGSKKLQKG